MPEKAKNQNSRPSPPGRTKIIQALKTLLGEKEFSAVTTAEIAATAGVTEALIYKYFKDKRDLLHQVLTEFLNEYLGLFERDLKGIKGALNKLRKLIWSYTNVYVTNRVFARIMLIEVRNYPDYYKSDTYALVKKHSDLVYSIIREGVETGEIRDDLDPRLIRQSVIGSVEQACLNGILFNRDINPDEITEHLCEILFSGMIKES